MASMYPTKSDEKFVYLIYGGHIAVITGLAREPLSLEGINTIEELISRLDEEYHGFKEVFIPSGGIFNSRTAITLTRVGKPSFAVIDQKEKIEAGDVLLLW